MADAPTAFPPLTPADIAAYPDADLLDGYLSYEAGDPEPGANRSPGFRWGWTNRRRDHQDEDDGFDGLRHLYLRARRSADAMAALNAARDEGVRLIDAKIGEER